MNSAEPPASTIEAHVRDIWQRDSASRDMGMEIEAFAAGEATVSMVVRNDMINAHGSCHGCFIFAVADTAFELACNSHGPVSVAADCQISFLRPGKPGEKLTAAATETYRRGRNGIYDIVVTGEDGATVAVFRGKSRQLSDKPRPTPEDPQ